MRKKMLFLCILTIFFVGIVKVYADSDSSSFNCKYKKINTKSLESFTNFNPLKGLNNKLISELGSDEKLEPDNSFYNINFSFDNENKKITINSCIYSDGDITKDCTNYYLNTSNHSFSAKCPSSMEEKNDLILSINIFDNYKAGTYKLFSQSKKGTAKATDSCKTCFEKSHNCASCDGCMLNDANECISMYSNQTAEFTSCGGGMLTDIPTSVPRIISIIYTAIEIAVPIVLVIMGMIDLFKAMSAGKEDEIKKNQSILVKRLIAAVLVFFVLVIVKFLITLFADNGSNIMNCVECFVKNACGV
ncbi:MAG: hypothetical protein Q4E75_03980 [bacterium]|nr:hypothetical protein [bacterium]